MAKAILKVDIDKVKKDFKAMQERLSKPATIGDVLTGKAWQDVDQHFRNSQGPDGQWPAIEPRRTRKGQKGKGGDKPLLDTGRLRSSIRDRVENGVAMLYTNIEYAAVHNYGYAKRNIKKRTFFWLSAKAIGSMTNFLKNYIVTGQK